MKARLLLIGVLPFVASCAEPETSTGELRVLEARATELARLLSGEESTQSDAVVVKLQFDESVDLDLYVTDPLLETIYFARHESRTGGAISADVRCDTTGPRVEEIRFTDPWPGRYRVGVDFPARCDGTKSRAPAPYAVSVNAGGTVHEAHGLVNLKHFEVVVLEFELDGPRQDHEGS